MPGLPAGPRALRRRLLAAALTALAAPGAQAQSELPTALHGIAVGARWEAVAPKVEAESLDHLTSEWDHHARECGYATLRVASDEGDLIVVVQNHLVVEVRHALPIPPGSDLRAIANETIARYGQPERAEMRDGFGRPTLGGEDGLGSVLLEYAGEHQVRFTVFADALWERMVAIRHRDRQLEENRTLLCARERQRGGE